MRAATLLLISVLKAEIGTSQLKSSAQKLGSSSRHVIKPVLLVHWQNSVVVHTRLYFKLDFNSGERESTFRLINPLKRHETTLYCFQELVSSSSLLLEKARIQGLSETRQNKEIMGRQTSSHKCTRVFNLVFAHHPSCFPRVVKKDVSGFARFLITEPCKVNNLRMHITPSILTLPSLKFSFFG